MIRLGFIGVGRWARKLAESFRACGAEVVAFDRKSGFERSRCPYNCDNGYESTGMRCPQGCDAGWENLGHAEGFGAYQPWRDQLADKSIDAIIAVAPPDVTTQVALACAAAGKPVMATKPLWDHPERITAPFYVDFWRLWSEAHQAALRGRIDFHALNLYGSGPLRDFPGAFDYGPHVMAAVLDLAGDEVVELRAARKLPCDQGELFEADLLVGEGKRLVHTKFGNGSIQSIRTLWGHDEAPTHLGGEPRDAIMQKMCRAFISDVQEGYVDTRLLRLSRDGMQLLRRIREEAK